MNQSHHSNRRDKIALSWEVPNEDNIAFQKDVHNFFVDLLAYQNDSAKAAANHTSDKKNIPRKMKELAAQEDKWKKEMAAAELKSEQELLKLFDTFGEIFSRWGAQQSIYYSPNRTKWGNSN